MRSDSDPDAGRHPGTVALLQEVATAANLLSVEDCMRVCVRGVCALTSWPIGHAWTVAGGADLTIEPADVWHLDDALPSEEFRAVTMAMTFRPDQGFVGRVYAQAAPLWNVDVATDALFARRAAAAALGIHAAFAFPVLAGREVVAILEFFSGAVMPSDEALLRLMRLLGTQLGRAIERERSAAALRASAVALEGLSRRLMTVQEDERSALARELHDEVGQALTALRLNLEALPTPAEAEHARRLQESRELAEALLQRTRTMSLDLRPSVLDDLGLAAALRWYVDRETQRARIAGSFQSSGLDERIPPLIEITCFRLVQQALTNVVRHASAARVSVLIDRTADEIDLRIRDDGVGFDVEAARARGVAGASMGLRSMEERTRLLGGEITITSTPVSGTEVRILIPLVGAATQ